MLSRQENELLTRTGPGTAAGELMRRYWQPAALSEELPPGGAPVSVRLFGEDLVLFRTPSPPPLPEGGEEKGAGGIALLGLHCSHRGADLSYGRIEDGGLRCIYHGWLYDIQGRCLEQPGEPAPPIADFGLRSTESVPARSALRTPQSEIKHLAYPCQEVGGIIYTYMGPGEPPLLPPYEFIGIAREYRDNAKVFQDCNYLQGNEGNMDPAHLSFLHRLRTDDPESAQALNTESVAPIIEAEETDYGVRIYCVRRVHGDRNYVRVTNYIVPNLCAVSGTADGYQVIWHVPIDDTHHWRYMIWFSRSRLRPARYAPRGTLITEDFRLTRHKANRYLQDRMEMTTESFSGLGRDFLPHDTCATEGAGPIQDRSHEHLGSTDSGIVAARKVLLRAIEDVQAGREAPGLMRDAESEWRPDIWARSDVLLPSSMNWHAYWKGEAATRSLATVAP